MPASIRQDGYNAICTILYFYKGEIMFIIRIMLRQFHHQNYAINYTTAGSVTPWSIRCILMRNPGQCSSEIAQTKYRTGVVNALQVLVYYFTIIRTGLSLLYNPFGALSIIMIILMITHYCSSDDKTCHHYILQ